MNIARIDERATFFRRKQSRVLHVAADESGSLLGCGRPLSLQYKVCSERCKQCFKKYVC